MGVTKLLDLKTTKNKILRELFVEIPDLETFPNICVDASYIAYTISCSLYTKDAPLDPNRDAFKRKFAYLISKLNGQNASMIFVFDGFNAKKEFIREKRTASVNNCLNKRIQSMMQTTYNIDSGYKMVSRTGTIQVEYDAATDNNIVACGATDNNIVTNTAFSIAENTSSIFNYLADKIKSIMRLDSTQDEDSTATTSTTAGGATAQDSPVIFEFNYPYPTRDDYEFMREFLTMVGIPFITAKGMEAEQLAVLLCKKLNYDAVLSADTDVLMCGGTLLTMTRTGYRYLSCQTILENIGVDYERFVRICLHMGCDFCKKTKFIGPKTALKKDEPLTEDQLEIYRWILDLNYKHPICFKIHYNDIETIKKYLTDLQLVNFQLPYCGQYDSHDDIKVGDIIHIRFPYTSYFKIE
jgi:XPG I-region